ncbi:uncharacterized protein [Penaeus vannamei]|uniref:uncharacterized protein n=1 Tax=Penaeus vannamei TaxID=6689 RepID=UPI00387F635F
MGNTVVKESEEPSEGVQSLNLSRRVTPEQFLKHSSGEFLEGCLLEVPWGIYYNTISMYEEINASFNFISEVSRYNFIEICCQRKGDNWSCWSLLVLFTHLHFTFCASNNTWELHNPLRLENSSTSKLELGITRLLNNFFTHNRIKRVQVTVHSCFTSNRCCTGTI